MPVRSKISIIADDGVRTQTFDVVREYTLTSQVNVTDHPVETGANVADHAQPLPKLLSMRAKITETPFAYVSLSGGAARVQQALEFLDSIAGTLVTVVSSRFGTMSNMAITRYPTTATATRALEFDIEFKRVNLAEAGLILIPPEAPTTSSASSGLPDEQDVGEQPTTDTSTTEATSQESDSSYLLDILESLGVDP